MDNNILVSVVCTTYNHASFIRQCLDGFVMQKTSFNFEVIIHDDASTDETPSIIAKYANEHPGLFRTILQKENQYSRNIPIGKTFIYPICRGKYIAYCEGDDYWTDPLKLQKQVDFLEAHPNYGIAHTHARIFLNDRNTYDTELKGRPIDSFEQLLCNCTIATLTVMIRRELVVQYQEDIHPEEQGWLMGDYPLWLYCATKMKIHLIPEVTATYRMLANSASHSTDRNRVVRFWESSHDIQLFYAEREHVSPALLHKINNAYEERIICHLVHVSPEKAAERLNKATELTMWQRIVIRLKIYRMKLLRFIGKNY